ncbi:hypothetical protein TNCV_4188831 [Trichonephila clavipes]|nr:hypothetical protein TNCV_4188831 [Trichonephila clavipes]
MRPFDDVQFEIGTCLGVSKYTYVHHDTIRITEVRLKKNDEMHFCIQFFRWEDHCHRVSLRYSVKESHNNGRCEDRPLCTRPPSKGRQATSHLVRLGKERREAPDHSLIIGVEPCQNVLSPAWCSEQWAVMLASYEGGVETSWKCAGGTDADTAIGNAGAQMLVKLLELERLLELGHVSALLSLSLAYHDFRVSF